MGLRKGVEAVQSLKSHAFEAGTLPDAEKERLCRDLLAEFGVTQVKIGGDGEELIHSCTLPNGNHAHGDRDASASLNYRKLTFNCMGCGSSGGFLWWIATNRGEDTDEARRWLEDQTGAGADEQSLVSLLQFFDAVYGPKPGQRREPMPKMSPRVLEPWRRIHPYLTDPIAEGGRGISEQAVVRFQVGYAEAFKVKTGEDEQAKPIFIESPRIVIPHFWKGDLVGWQTRRLVDDGTAKYLSSASFPKDTTIYNYDATRRRVVVVESPMSVLSCADDVPDMEGTFGAKVTDRQCALLSMHQRVILWMDNDKAGWKATERVAGALEGYSDVWVVDTPWTQDPADLPSTERLRLLADPLPIALWRPPKRLRDFG